MARNKISTESVDVAIEAFGIDLDNRDFVRQVCRHIGIRQFTVGESWIKAERTGGGPALNIAPGWTNGFTSQHEALEASGGASEVWLDRARAKSIWGVSHPKNWIHDGSGARTSKAVRDYGTCPTCGYALPATGVCDNCD